jgi:hypothetical protein
MSDWIFQVNPRRYDVHRGVAEGRQTWWNAPRYRDRMAVGDRAWIQIVGPDHPGIYYIATIVSLPYERLDSEFGRWKIDVRFDYRIEPPMLRSELRDDAEFASFHPFRGFQGSNAPVPDLIAERLWQEAKTRAVPLGEERSPAPTPDSDVAQSVERHNASVRQDLKAAIGQLDPIEFEYFVVRVLTTLGYEVEHTGRTNDGGVDAEAVLSLEGLTSVMTKVQAKRWAHMVSPRVVRELRGALKVDERGLIVTTAEFTDEAIREAQAEGKARIGLLGGGELARLCAREGIGVKRRHVDLVELDSDDLAASGGPVGG